MAAQATIHVESCSSDASIVTLRGVHDLSTRPALTMALAMAARRPCVLVDLSDCLLTDGASIEPLLLVAERLRERAGALELIVPAAARALRRQLERGGAEMLRVHATRAAAVASIESAERVRALRQARSGLRAISERIDSFQAATEARRGTSVVRRGGVTVVRARITDAPAARPPAGADLPDELGEAA